MFGEDDAKRLVEILQDLRKEMTAFKERRNNSQVVHQHVNAGGHAVWAVVVMAAVIFTVAIMQQPRISELERKVDRLQDYVNVLYQQPLKEKSSVDNNHHNTSEGSGTEP